MFLQTRKQFFKEFCDQIRGEIKELTATKARVRDNDATFTLNQKIELMISSIKADSYPEKEKQTMLSKLNIFLQKTRDLLLENFFVGKIKEKKELTEENSLEIRMKKIPLLQKDLIQTIKWLQISCPTGNRQKCDMYIELSKRLLNEFRRLERRSLWAHQLEAPQRSRCKRDTEDQRIRVLTKLTENKRQSYAQKPNDSVASDPGTQMLTEIEEQLSEINNEQGQSHTF